MISNLQFLLETTHICIIYISRHRSPSRALYAPGLHVHILQRMHKCSTQISRRQKSIRAVCAPGLHVHPLKWRANALYRSADVKTPWEHFVGQDFVLGDDRITEKIAERRQVMSKRACPNATLHLFDSFDLSLAFILRKSAGEEWSCIFTRGTAPLRSVWLPSLFVLLWFLQKGARQKKAISRIQNIQFHKEGMSMFQYAGLCALKREQTLLDSLKQSNAKVRV